MVPCSNSDLLIMLVLGSLVCEWLWYLFYVSSLLIMPILGSPACEWLWYLVVILAC